MAQRDIEAVYNATPVQAGILYHVLKGSRPGAYVEQFSVDLVGLLDSERFERAWQDVVARHAALRTFFVWENRDHPLQIVRAHATVPLRCLDWTEVAANELEGRWSKLLAQDRAEGFELEKAPLVRLALVRLEGCRHRLLVSFQHLILDGWSLHVILKEVLERHDGADRHESQALGPAFVDYVRWLKVQNLSKAEAFWRERLAGFEAPTTPSGSPDGDSSRFGSLDLAVPAATHQGLQGVARLHGITLGALFLAAWAILLGRATGERDVVFGTTVAGRPADLPGIESAVGLYINTLPVRVELPVGASVLSVVEQVQEWLHALTEHNFTPPALAQSASDVPPGTPLFDSVVVVENVPVAPSSSELTLADPRYVEFSHYPLSVIVHPGADLHVGLIYDPARFGAEDAGRFVNGLGALLAHMAAELEAPLSAVSLRAAAPEPRSSSDTWSAPFEPVQARFARIAREWPEAPALFDEKEVWSYGELLRFASRVASALIARGVGRDEIVPVLAENKCHAVGAMLGVLMAGGAYVPLDETWPSGRLRDVIDGIAEASGRANPVLLLASQAKLEPDLRVEVIDLAALPDSPLREPVPVDPDQLAYVIFTSGSTGRPKGVMVSQGNLAYSTAVRDQIYEGPPKRFLLLSPLSVDSSVAGLYWALTTGGGLVLSRRRAEQEPDTLLQRIAATGVTHTLCLPSLYRHLLDCDDNRLLEQMDCVIVAAEACPQSLVDDHRLRLPSVKLYNEYGPSEGTVWATVDRLDTADTMTIGRALPGSSVWIVDHEAQPLPAGWPGELVIAGPGVARGYLGQAELTADRFVSLPALNGRRVYRTGDRARFLADGRIELLGRIDNQVKLRGFRIEPEEIENVIVAHPQVLEAAVQVESAGRNASSSLLVAYVAGQTDDEQDLRTHCTALLPDHMVPRHFVHLQALPRSNSGKIDRRALTSISGLTSRDRGTDVAEPRNAREAILRDIWQEVLGLAQVSIHDDYFTVGGDSLMSIRILSRARRAGLAISPEAFFAAPTIAAQASVATATESDTAPVVEAKASSPSAAPERASVDRAAIAGMLSKLDDGS